MLSDDVQHKRLNIAGIDVETYSYEASKSQTGTLITIHIALTRDAATRLRGFILSKMNTDRAGHYFLVMVDGDPQPLEMRFGIIFWSQHDTVIKYELNLVEKSKDVPPYSFIEYENIGNRRRDNMVAETNAALTALMSLLVEKDILKQEDCMSVLRIGKEQTPSLLFQFREVVDVDEWAEIATPFEIADSNDQ